MTIAICTSRVIVDDEAVLIGKGDGQHHHHQDRGDDVAQPPQDFVVEDDVVPRDFGLLDDASHDLQQQQADRKSSPTPMATMMARMTHWSMPRALSAEIPM